MTVPNFGGQPGQGQQQQGWIPQQQPQPQQQPNQQPFNPQTTVVQADPHVQMPQPYFPPPQQQQQPQQPSPSQQIYPNQPQFAPAWQGGQQIQPGQQQQQQPALPWQQQRQQQQPQVPYGTGPAASQQVQFDQQGRMFGPGLPQELQGKTMAEAVQLYGMMRQGYIATQAQQRQQQPQQPQPTPTQQGQIQAQARPTSPWTDPEGFFGRIIEEKLSAALAPVTQATFEDQIGRTRDQIAAAYPIYAQVEPQVLQKLQGLPPETLTNPEAWKLALSAVLGERQLQPQRNGQPQPQQNGQPQLPWGSPMPIAQLPWQQAQQPQAHQSFFTESPSAVMQGGYAPGDQPLQGQYQLTPQQKEVARRFGMTEQQYLQGMGIR